MNPLRYVTLQQPSTALDSNTREKLVAAVEQTFAIKTSASSEAGIEWTAPPAERADQLKAWLADHWLALEEDHVLLLPTEEAEPGALNVNVDGRDVFVGVASLPLFKQAAEKLADLPKPVESLFQSAMAYSQPLWLCVT